MSEAEEEIDPGGGNEDYCRQGDGLKSSDLPPLSSIGPEDATDVGDDATFEHSPRIAEQIGPYRIVREIGEGGMGSVYEAQQLEPVKRSVALKVIKAGRDSKSVIARFEAERQALAMMDHPAIARIIDAGTTKFGQPFFAMELVDGVPLTTYCDARSLSIQDRLGLFCQICEGIQHAHQKGIIHRDLKPGNILVTEYDGKPVPKIIDFGLAKALETTPKLTDKSLHTEIGQVLGTIKYMSPEQAGLDALDIDTRTDIYSLGIILYELLTGSTPLDDSSIKENALLKVLEIVRGQEASKPSSKLSTDADRMSNISSRRKIEPKRLNSILAGELDWVVMKSLEKERDRRYASANEFAEDIKRYLNQEPILARPPSRSYQLQKFVRKNKGLVASISSVIAVLLCGIGGSTWFALGEQNAKELAFANEKKALRNERLAIKNEELAAKNEKLARASADQSKKDKAVAEAAAKRSADALKIFTDSFRSIDPEKGANSKMLAKDVLLQAHEKLKQSQLDDEGKAELLGALTKSLLGVGEYDSAIKTAQANLEIHRRKLGPDHPHTLTALGNLALSYDRAERRDQALELYQEMHKRSREILGPDHPHTLNSMSSLAVSYLKAGKVEQALEMNKQVLHLRRKKLGADHTLTLVSMGNLAQNYARAGESEKALALNQEVFELRREKLGPDHPHTLLSMSGLALGYANAGKYDQAIEQFEEVLKLSQNKLGLDHPDNLYAMGNLAVCYAKAGKNDQANVLFKEVLKLKRRKLGRDHPGTQLSTATLGANYIESGRVDEAIPLLEEVYKHSRTNETLEWVAPYLQDGYIKGNQNDKLKKLIGNIVSQARQSSEPEKLNQELLRGGSNLMKIDAFADAEVLFAEHYERQEKKDAKNWRTFNAQSLLGWAVLKQGRLKEAKSLLENGYGGLKDQAKKIPKDKEQVLSFALDSLIELAKESKNDDELKKWQAQLWIEKSNRAIRKRINAFAKPR